MKIAVAHNLEIFDPRGETHRDQSLILPISTHDAVMGQTIDELIEDSNWRFDVPTVCKINGLYYSRAEWSTYCLSCNDNVEFISRPLGGGGSSSSTAKSIGAIVGLIALSAIVPFILGPAGLALPALFAKIGGAILIGGGSLLISHLLRPKPAGKSAVTEQLYSFAFSANQARPLQAIPVQYGRTISVLDLAAPSYSEYDGDSMVTYNLYMRTCGRMYSEELRIGDTTIWTVAGGLDPLYPGVELQFVEPGDTVTLFPVNVVTSGEVSGIELSTTVTPPYTVNAANTLATQIMVDLVWPSGSQVTRKEETYAATTQIDFQVRTIDAAGAATSGWTTVLNKSYVFNKQSMIRITERITVSPARYQMRLTRSPSITGSDPFNGSVKGTDTVQWTALRAQINGPQTFAGVSLLAVKVVSSKGLSGFSNGKLGHIGTRILPVWNGSTFVEQATRSIAWAALDAWRNSDYSAGLSVTQVHFQSFTSLDTLWAGLGHSFDYVFKEPKSLDETLRTILNAGRAMPSTVGDRLTLVRDELRSIPKMMFNDGNMVKGSLTRTYILADSQFADGVVGQYLDETSWRLSDVSSAPDGVTLTKPSTIEVTGVVKRAQAAGVVRFTQAQHTKRRITFEWMALMEGRRLQKGDLVTLSSDEPETWGQSLEIRDYDIATRRIIVSPPAKWDIAVANHYVEIQLKNGVPYGPVRVTKGANDAELIINASDITTFNASQATSIWDQLNRAAYTEPALVSFSPGQKRTMNVLITKGEPDDDGEHITLTGVLDDVSVYSVVETGVTPIPQLPLVRQSGLPVIPAISLRVVQRGVTLWLMAGWVPAPGALTYILRISYDAGQTYVPIPEVQSTSIEFPVGGAQLIRFEVAGVTAAGLAGGWYAQTVAPPPIILDRNFVTINLRQEDMEPTLKTKFDLVQGLSRSFDTSANAHVLASASYDANLATISEIKKVETDSKQALAVFGIDLLTQFGNSQTTVSARLQSLTTATETYGQAGVQLRSEFNNFTVTTVNYQLAQADLNAATSQALTSTVASLGNLSATVQTQQNAQVLINGQLIGSYIAKIDLNGFVSGFQLVAESGPTQPAFAEARFLADKFLIGAPTVGGVAPVYPFSVVIVNGQARVGVRGDLIGDGTLSFRSITTPDLSAISANLGNITAGAISFPAGSPSYIEMWD